MILKKIKWFQLFHYYIWFSVSNTFGIAFTSCDVFNKVDSWIRSNGIELNVFWEESGIEIGVKAVPLRIGPSVAIDVTIHFRLVFFWNMESCWIKTIRTQYNKAWKKNVPGRRFATGSPSIKWLDEAFWLDRIGSDWPTLADRLNGFWRQHGLGKTVCRIGLKRKPRFNIVFNFFS